MQELHSRALKNSRDTKLLDYVHPNEVVQDDTLPVMEKRALLCAWASDACAVESRPGFRWLPGTPGPILVDHVLTALRTLDGLDDGLQHADYHPKCPVNGALRTAQSSGTAGVSVR